MLERVGVRPRVARRAQRDRGLALRLLRGARRRHRRARGPRAHGLGRGLFGPGRARGPRPAARDRPRVERARRLARRLGPAPRGGRGRGLPRRVVPRLLPHRGRRRRRGPRRRVGAPLRPGPRGAPRRERLVAAPPRRRGRALGREDRPPHGRRRRLAARGRLRRAALVAGRRVHAGQLHGGLPAPRRPPLPPRAVGRRGDARRRGRAQVRPPLALAPVPVVM
mmetsp:Transcript_25500/g.87224  ORF Transcript_25500/g.87224 Transcript_25500/m.87224 type:complete len:223 (-) Transcript_25500:24-692(-)